MVSFGQAAVGIILLLVVIGGFLYLFYSRTNAVEKTGSGALIMLGLVSLMIPIFWIAETGNQAQAQADQHAYAIQQGMMLYAQYCTDQCYGIKDGKIVNPTYNGYTIDQLNQMTDDQITRIVAAGEYGTSAPKPVNDNLITRSYRFGGPLTDGDVGYLMEFIRSADPQYQAKNGFPNTPNAFTQLPAYLQSQAPSAYSTAVAFGTVGQFGAPLDKSNQKQVTIPIVQTSSTQQCDSGCYEYPNVKVKVGSTITWVNQSKVAHTVTAIIGKSTGSPKIAKEMFDSGIGNLMQPGQKFTWTVTAPAYTFNSDHTLVYYCQVHPNYMFAELTIVQ